MRRRTFVRHTFALGGALALPSLAPQVRSAEPAPGSRSPAGPDRAARRELVARPATEPLVGMPWPHTPVLGFDGTVPGPELRVPAGEPLSLRIVNGLDQPTSVHWHGVRAPWSMDGVAGLTQAPIPPGDHFDVDFTPPDAGTYWYHAHANTPEQVGRGLHGTLIVEEAAPIAVDRELVWTLDDWRLTPEATIVEGFANGHDLSHAGRIGNTVTLNGRREPPVRVRAGERVRLRLINAANARQFALDFGELAPRIVAIDGQPVAPHAPDGLVTLASAGRVDLVVDLPPRPSARFDVIDRAYREPVTVGWLATDRTAPLRNAPPQTPIDLGAPTLPEPDLGSAIELEVRMDGGAMRGLPRARLGGEWLDGRALARRGKFWALNELVSTGYDAPPLLEVERGRTVRLALVNDTAFVHPMHLHGHHVKLLSRGGRAPARTTWHDSVSVAPDERVEVAFVADNPARWLFHCHVLEHHLAGLGALVHVT